MGNAVSPCFHPDSESSVKLIFWEGTTKMLSISHSKKQRRIAGEIMFEFPDKMVCHADSFFLGHPIPCLSLEDELLPGHTYFVLPFDFFRPPVTSSYSAYTLSASTLAAIGSTSSQTPKRALMDFGEDGPFQYVKGEDGRLLMKVCPDFIIRIINKGKESCDDAKDRAKDGSLGSILCSSLELKKQYEQLVRCREHVWSPKLETITEHKARLSPCIFMRKQKGN